ncbi:MAG TPA: glycosyltransferase [Gammaproteobacteria bacterium]|nr:glycosyltransferase [Gammaproteobacteria bacterium]
MKILHIGKYYPPFHGGMEVYLRDLAEQQAKSHDVTVLVHNHQFSKLFSGKTEEVINSVKVIRNKTIKPILFAPIMLGMKGTVENIIEQHQIDVIHISWPNPSALFLLLSRKAKSIPWVIQWQSDMVTAKSSILLKLAYFFFKPLEKMLLKQSSKVIASTQEYFNYSSALKKFPEKCVFIPLGLKLNLPEIKQAHLNWANTLWANASYKIYHIGRLTFYKNQKLLLEAAKLLPEAKFIITGSGQLEKELQKIIKENNLSNVELTGNLSNQRLNALLKTCDVFCLPSNDRAESYGMVLLEALAMNKRILVSDLPGSGMKWIASQTELGETFDCNDTNDLAEKIKGSSVNIELDRDKFNKTFSIESCAEKIDEVYMELFKN